MANEIYELLDGDEFVSVYFKAKSLPEVNYQVNGLSGVPRNEKEWEATGGVEGTFEFKIFGEISYPERWSGFSCELNVNSLGSELRVDYEPQGFLDDGWCKNKNALFRLYVKPSIAKDIMNKIFYFNNKDLPSFRLDLVDLQYGQKLVEGAIVYKIIRAYC